MTERLDRRQLLILLGSWAAAILLPAIIMLHQSLTLAYVVWGLAFLGQLTLFFKIAKVTRETELWPWLFASVFPWVVNFETPRDDIWLSLLLALVFGAVLAGFAVYLFRKAVVADRMEHGGVAAVGTVVDVVEPRFANLVVTEGDVRRTIRLSVKRTDQAEPYEASLRGRFQLDELPSAGEVLDVRIDPENPQRVQMTGAEPAVDGETANPTTPD